jgi:hypothetical protein
MSTKNRGCPRFFVTFHFAVGKLSFGEADYHSAEGGLSFERSEINLLKVLSLAIVSGILQ